MKRYRHIVFVLARASLGVGLLIYLGVSSSINWGALLGLIRAWPITASALLILLVDAGLMAWRLSLLLRAKGFFLSLGSSLRLTLIGIFFNLFLLGATGGDVVKLFYATQGNPGRRTEVATIVLLDRAVGMFALLILPLLLVPFFSELFASSPILRDLVRLIIFLAVAMLLGSILCLSSRVRNLRFVSWLFAKVPGGAYAETIFHTVHGYRHNLGTIGASVAISLVTHVLATVVTLLSIQAINPAGFSWVMAALIPLGHLANSLPLTPGGLGVGEAAFGALFAVAGLTGGAEALLGWRLLNFLIGLPGLLFYLHGRRRFVHVGEDSQVSSARV